jgi:hypothetical protein
MSETHSFWDHGTERARQRQVLVVLTLLTAFGILVGTTLLGVIVNWPPHRHRPTPALLRHPKTFDATVTGLRATPDRSEQRCMMR